MKFLVTGGLGFIGSHTTIQLINAGHEVVILDNLSNSSLTVLERIQQLVHKQVAFYQADICNADELATIFAAHQIEGVIHFAGLKAVGESVQKPLTYYRNNVAGTLTLLEQMHHAGVHKFIFSSSATVYGQPQSVPIQESAPVGGTTNPYGTSKYMVERLLQDYAAAHPQLSVVILRYFNPIGAHISGLIGEDPHDMPNNLMPYISQVAVGRLKELAVFGDDYPTQDGTGVRDYIHVEDLAFGHLKALDYTHQNQGVALFNLGTGQGYSVLEMIQAFEQHSGQSVPYRIAPRRSGDIATCYADPTYAQQELKWQATRQLSEMIEDTWRWQKNNPQGYTSTSE